MDMKFSGYILVPMDISDMEEKSEYTPKLIICNFDKFMIKYRISVENL